MTTTTNASESQSRAAEDLNGVDPVRTFRQYASEARRAKRDEYGVSVKASHELWHDDMLRIDWIGGLRRFASRDGIIPPSVVRTLTENERYWIAKFGYSCNRALLADGRTVAPWQPEFRHAITNPD